MSFKQYLLEQMTTTDAIQLLGLSSTYDTLTLKRAYRKASNMAHPDKGGSVDLQQRVNAAYKVLQGTEDGKDPMNVYRNRREEEKERGAMAKAFVVQLFNQYFQPHKYAEYFKKYSGKEFKFESVINVSSSFGAYVGVTYRFASTDQKTFFDLTYTCHLRFSNILGGSGESTGLDYMVGNTD